MLRPALCLVLAGCTTTLRGYPGEPLPAEQTAVIVSRAASAMTVNIVALDGVPVDALWDRGDRLELTPGRHVITLDLTWRVKRLSIPFSLDEAVTELAFAGVNAAVSTQATAAITVDVEAGRRYTLVASVPSDGEAEYEIADRETGAIVAAR
jgi:hypothetical protein